MNSVKDVSYGWLRILGFLLSMSFFLVLFVVGGGMLSGEMEVTVSNLLILVWMPFVVLFCLLFVVSPIVLILTLLGLLR